MMIPAELIRKFSFVFLIIALLVAVADVYPLGIDVQGNKGWIGLLDLPSSPPKSLSLRCAYGFPRRCMPAAR